MYGDLMYKFRKIIGIIDFPYHIKRGWSVVRCWVNFQCRGVLLILIKVGHWRIVLAIGADGGYLDIFIPDRKVPERFGRYRDEPGVCPSVRPFLVRSIT